MKKNYRVLGFFLVIFFNLFLINANVYNSQSSFSVEVVNLEKDVLSDNIVSEFEFKVKNNLDKFEEINFFYEEIKGWDILVDEKKFKLKPYEEKLVKVKFKANSEFNYQDSVVSFDTIKISQKSNYVGVFNFPFVIGTDNREEDVNLIFKINVEDQKKEELFFNVEFSTDDVCVVKPLNFVVEAKNLDKEEDVEIILNIAGENYVFFDKFSSQNNYKVYSQKIPISLNPSSYLATLSVKVIKEVDDKKVSLIFEEKKEINVLEYEDIYSNSYDKKSFFVDKFYIDLENRGNVDKRVRKQVKTNFFKKFFLYSNVDDFKIEDNVIIFDVDLKKSEKKTIYYSYNYVSIYLIIVAFLIFFSYIFVKKSSNPVDLETQLYQVKKVMHEGVKSLKVKIGFENIKEGRIDKLRIIFRMPSYLNVEDNSFLLTEPNQVLKGKNQFKLIWDFRKFEKDEHRIIGFSLVNKRGVLGDIRIPHLEIEVKTGGKIRRYYKSFPSIRG